MIFKDMIKMDYVGVKIQIHKAYINEYRIKDKFNIKIRYTEPIPGRLAEILNTTIEAIEGKIYGK